MNRSKGLTDSSVLIEMLLGASGNFNQLPDLREASQEMTEAERKYYVGGRGSQAGEIARLDLFKRIREFCEDNTTLHVVDSVTFAGVDQYYIVQSNDKEFSFRYRVGANRHPQITIKYPLEKESSSIRGEIELDVRETSPKVMQGFAAVICKLSEKYQLFTVQQSGNIFYLEQEENGNLMEIVVYKVEEIPDEGKYSDTERRVQIFAEIEALRYSSFEEALDPIKKFEKKLELSNDRCEDSIADLFRPNEWTKND